MMMLLDDTTQMVYSNFKTAILKPSLCGYSDAYILMKRTIKIVGQGADVAAIAADRNN